MAAPAFFHRDGLFRLDALSALSGATLLRRKEGNRLCRDVAPLDTAGPEDVSFLENRKYIEAFLGSRAGAAFVDEKAAERAPSGMALLVSKEPYRAYALAAQAFYPPTQIVALRAPSAIIDPAAYVPDNGAIGPHVVIEPGARLGQPCSVGANTVIAAGVEIGDDCRIGPNVTLSHCLIGLRVVLHPGVRIGQDGFGFAPDAKAPIKVPQLGRVLIGDDVDIGANTTIDRGSGHDTIIGSGSTIDNSVQFGPHWVVV